MVIVVLLFTISAGLITTVSELENPTPPSITLIECKSYSGSKIVRIELLENTESVPESPACQSSGHW